MNPIYIFLVDVPMIYLLVWVGSLQVGELTALLTSDLGSLKSIVSENISRDRGFRALSEASYPTLNTSEIYLFFNWLNHNSIKIALIIPISYLDVYVD